MDIEIICICLLRDLKMSIRLCQGLPIKPAEFTNLVNNSLIFYSTAEFWEKVGIWLKILVKILAKIAGQASLEGWN